MGTLRLPALSENTRARARLTGREEETAERRGLPLEFRWTNVKKDDVEQRERKKTEKRRERKRKGGEGAQYFLNSTSSGGLISTFLLPTSFQLVLRTVPPDSIKDLFMALLTSSEPSQ